MCRTPYANPGLSEWPGLERLPGKDLAEGTNPKDCASNQDCQWEDGLVVCVSVLQVANPNGISSPVFLSLLQLLDGLQ